MGVRLVVEVLDHAPPDLDRAERLVLIAIAEKARDSTRLSQCGREFLLRRSGLGPRGLRKVFERLAAHGWEVRVPIGIDRLGRPLYAVPGVQSTYRVPAFLRGKGELEDPDKGELEDRQAVPEDRQAVPEDRQAVPEDPPVPHPSSLKQQHARKRATRQPDHLRMIMDRVGASAEEAAAVAAAVDAEKHPDNLPGFLRRLAADGELGDWLARVRVERGRAAAAADEAEHRARIRGEPWCEHGHAGGHIPSPAGWVSCHIERRRLRAAGGRT